VDEWADGHIIGALHHPSDEWRSRDYVRKIAEAHLQKDSVILHCFKSQQRGPTCARVLATQYEIIQAENKDNPDFKTPLM
jgi:rhodanese-related sulfurtransferase